MGPPISVGDDIPLAHPSTSEIMFPSAHPSLPKIQVSGPPVSIGNNFPPAHPSTSRIYITSAHGIALAFSHHSSNTQGTSNQAPTADVKAGTFLAVYLLEEPVTFDSPGNQTFTKFIHNKDCKPSLDDDEYSYDLAVFLAFTQYIQYAKTDGLAFVSDYQGSTELLTDPQILTHHSVSDGNDFFGDGNITSMVDDFEMKHVCNYYCKWPGFGLEVYA
ncbi:hypothetical protein BDR07DRAFT_1496197 [Suillus spraguei]|nr:hypothetical protein BDR07DRAFT_1496197 [Suillus spraguei]